ncbi:MAG: hypothetical protein JOY69_04900 [Candidatus Eremiobacteraeota bacterium]|nr:hypothetical protein [Candidatus Eremiobacteraeota bacterium]
MTVPFVVAVVAVLLVSALALLFRRRRPSSSAPRPWTGDAGEEFAGLNESARCDFVFAIAALEDERSHGLLARALDDPSETVALAAARALVARGKRDDVGRYLTAHPDQRSQRIAATLDLLATE